MVLGTRAGAHAMGGSVARRPDEFLCNSAEPLSNGGPRRLVECRVGDEEVRSLSFPVLIYSCAHCGCAQESLLEHLLSKGSALTPYAPAGASLVGRVDDTTRASLLCKVCVLTHTHTHPHIQYVYAHTDTHTHVLIVRGSSTPMCVH